MNLTEQDILRFWSYVQIGGEGECWPWLGGKHRDGHGVFNVPSAKNTVAAHRLSFFLKSGYLPDYKKRRIVIHDCERHDCQNPKHLFEGTYKQNNNYPNSLHGRSGERNGNSTITDKIALEILNSKQRQFLIAKKYNVSQHTVCAIKRGRRWQHLQKLIGSQENVP